MQTLNCKFSCSKCGADRLGFIVREREPNESLPHWMSKVVGPGVRTAHANHSLLCDNTVLDVWMPVPKRGIPVGMVTDPKGG